MAIYHCSVKVVSRSTGRSSVGASAYRSGEKLYNERDGLTHDYTKRTGVEHQEIIAPKNAPEWASDREKLWNEVEKIEKSSKAQLAREVEVALPNELNKEEQIGLVRDYAKESFVTKGMVADIAIHDKGDGNPHAHIMLTMRPFKEDGSWESKQRKEYILDKNGQKQYDSKKKTYKCRTVKTTDWDKKETLEKWREDWSKHANKYLERNGHEERIDHRSYEEQGLEKVPTRHKGHIVNAMEKRGIETEIGNYNREIQEQNKMIGLIDKQINHYERSLDNERSKIDGTNNRDLGAERGSTKALSNILLKRNTRTSNEFDSRANHDEQQGKQNNIGVDGRQGKSEKGIGRGFKGEKQASIPDEQRIQRHETGTGRIKDLKPAADRKDVQGNIRGQAEKSGQQQGYDKSDKGTGIPFKTDSESKLERESETVRNPSADNNRDNCSNGGNLSTGNALNDILKALSSSIKKANAEQERKNQNSIKKELKSKQQSKSRNQSKGYDMDR